MCEEINGVKTGSIEGVVPVTVAYEYIIHWLRSRIPALKNLDLEDFIEAARIKVGGDVLLRTA